MPQDALKAVTLRNHFYRDGFRRLANLFVLSILLNVILFVTVIVIYKKKPEPVYFATTNDGRISKMPGLNTPVMTDNAVLAWTSRVVPSIYALDFLNYRQQIQASRIYFTKFGWEAFAKAFTPTMEQIQKGQLVMHGVPSDVPVITKKGLIKGIYSWQVQVPILVSYQKGKDEYTENVLWTIIIQRQNNAATGQLFGISQVIQTSLKKKTQQQGPLNQ